MSWSQQQEAAIKAARRWLKDRTSPQVFTLFGFAGTGKTTLARELAKELPAGAVRFAAYTGKAALVLRTKGCDKASTIHSMIYTPKDSDNGGEPEFVLKRKSELASIRLIIIDECSMVDEYLGRDLLSFGVKVLVLGDPAQLPPVSGAGFFTEGVTPDVMLTEIHRQAHDNPIIALSIAIREGRSITTGAYGESRIVPKSQIDASAILGADQVIVGLNKTRIEFNTRIRKLLGRQQILPEPEDKLVCLRNDKDHALLNGGLWSVKGVRPAKKTVVLTVASEDTAGQQQLVRVRQEFFTGEDANLSWAERRTGQEFTYGYALTCHKSQGSQWDNIIVLNEGGAFRQDANRWLYTAVTRAAEKITIGV